MRKIVFSFFIFCLFAVNFSAQTLVMPKDLKIAKVTDFLEKKGYQIIEKDEAFLKLTDSSNSSLYIDISDDKKSLLLNINILLNKGVSQANVNKFIEKVNDLPMIKGSYNKEKGAVFFQYSFWVSNGFTYESLADAVAEFFLYQGDAYAFDSDKIISFQE